MTKVAVNIVLLPSAEMIAEAIRLNAELLKTNPPKIVLDKQINQPHISLCMGAIDVDKIPEIITAIKVISRGFSSFKFTGELSVQHVSSTESVTWLELFGNKRIYNLQHTMMSRMWNFLSYTIEREMLVAPEEVDKNTITYISNFGELYKQPNRFKPHITIGVGDSLNVTHEFSFSASELGLFKLGNYCTCSELIFKTSLAG